MHWRAILQLRCPRCRRGDVFQSLLRTREQCPECGLLFAREPGFFLGAMYVSYALAILAALPICGVMLYYEWPVAWIMAAVVVELSLLAPLLFRYSRVVWLYFDQRIDPR